MSGGWFIGDEDDRPGGQGQVQDKDYSSSVRLFESMHNDSRVVGRMLTAAVNSDSLSAVKLLCALFSSNSK